jgi:hypothetical protein
MFVLKEEACGPPNALSYAASELNKSERSEHTIDRLSVSASVIRLRREPKVQARQSLEATDVWCRNYLALATLP